MPDNSNSVKKKKESVEQERQWCKVKEQWYLVFWFQGPEKRWRFWMIKKETQSFVHLLLPCWIFHCLSSLERRADFHFCIRPFTQPSQQLKNKANHVANYASPNQHLQAQIAGPVRWIGFICVISCFGCTLVQIMMGFTTWQVVVQLQLDSTLAVRAKLY